MLDFKKRPIIAMIHLAGADRAVEIALKEIALLESCGVDAILVENYHNSPDVVEEVLKQISTTMKVGINILPNDYWDAFELANKYNAIFIQMDYIAGTYNKTTKLNVDDYLKYRNKYPNIQVLGGVHPKYYTPLSDLADDLNDAMLLCDAIVVTGAGTGVKTPLDKIKEFKNKIGNFPLIIGAGLSEENVGDLIHANGAIVGSAFKVGKLTSQPIQKEYVQSFMKKKNYEYHYKN